MSWCLCAQQQQTYPAEDRLPNMFKACGLLKPLPGINQPLERVRAMISCIEVWRVYRADILARMTDSLTGDQIRHGQGYVMSMRQTFSY